MSARVTLVIVAVFAALAAAVAGLDRFGPAPSGATAAATPDAQLAIFEFDDRTVQTLTARVADKTVVLQRDGDAWKLADTGEPGIRTSINSLLVRMSTLRGTRRLDPSTDLASFGLAEPRIEATVQLDDGSTFGLQMGDRTPVGTGTYAKKADAPDVFVISNTFATDLERLVAEPREIPTPAPSPSASASPTP